MESKHETPVVQPVALSLHGLPYPVSYIYSLQENCSHCVYGYRYEKFFLLKRKKEMVAT
jgi:hypothetical protein